MLDLVKKQIIDFVEDEGRGEAFDPQNVVLKDVWEAFVRSDLEYLKEVCHLLKTYLYQGEIVDSDRENKAKNVVARYINYSSGKEVEEDKKFDNFIALIPFLAPDKESDRGEFRLHLVSFARVFLGTLHQIKGENFKKMLRELKGCDVLKFEALSPEDLRKERSIYADMLQIYAQKQGGFFSQDFRDLIFTMTREFSREGGLENFASAVTLSLKRGLAKESPSAKREGRLLFSEIISEGRRMSDASTSKKLLLFQIISLSKMGTSFDEIVEMFFANMPAVPEKIESGRTNLNLQNLAEEEERRHEYFHEYFGCFGYFIAQHSQPILPNNFSQEVLKKVDEKISFVSPFFFEVKSLLLMNYLKNPHNNFNKEEFTTLLSSGLRAVENVNPQQYRGAVDDLIILAIAYKPSSLSGEDVAEIRENLFNLKNPKSSEVLQEQSCDSEEEKVEEEKEKEPSKGPIAKPVASKPQEQTVYQTI